MGYGISLTDPFRELAERKAQAEARALTAGLPLREWDAAMAIRVAERTYRGASANHRTGSNAATYENCRRCTPGD